MLAFQQVNLKKSDLTPYLQQRISGQISDFCIPLPRNPCSLLLLSYLVWENSKSVHQNSVYSFLGEVGRPVINHLSWNAFISLPFLISVQQCKIPQPPTWIKIISLHSVWYHFHHETRTRVLWNIPILKQIIWCFPLENLKDLGWILKVEIPRESEIKMFLQMKLFMISVALDMTQLRWILQIYTINFLLQHPCARLLPSAYHKFLKETQQ